MANEYLIALVPSAGLVDFEDDGSITDMSFKRSLMKHLSLADYVGPCALRIVEKSLLGVLTKSRITSIRYDMRKLEYMITVVCSLSLATLKRALESNYRQRDTWMEGDIMLTPTCELHLAFGLLKKIKT